MNQIKKYIKRFLWQVGEIVDNIINRVKEWNDCPVCHGLGSWPTIIYDYQVQYERCYFCKGKGKVNIPKLCKWHWFIKIKPAVARVLIWNHLNLWQKHQKSLIQNTKRFKNKN